MHNVFISMQMFGHLSTPWQLRRRQTTAILLPSVPFTQVHETNNKEHELINFIYQLPVQLLLIF